MDIGEKYFVRAATYSFTDKKLVVTDPNAPRVITMDPWPEVVFAAAKGDVTVDEFTEDLRAQWGPDAPANLGEQVHYHVHLLVNEGLIKLSDDPQKLPPYLAVPVTEQDTKAMKEQMIADGFIEENG